MTAQQQLGDQPIQAEYRRMMEGVADALHEAFNGPGVPIGKGKTGFVLLVFPLGEDHGAGHRCNYISNANREDVKTMLREQLAYFEGMPSTTGRG
jgi:hypothetical protein